MVANTGTYLDSPFHRYADGEDLAELPLPSLADLPGIVVRRPWENDSRSMPTHFDGLDVRGKAVLVHTGWDRHWRTDRYVERSPVPDRRSGRLAGRATARRWSASTATISTIRASAPRPVHTRLLGAEIPICEHMTDLGSLPDEGFRFSAVPPKVRGMGTFPVRAYAVLG